MPFTGCAIFLVRLIAAFCAFFVVLALALRPLGCFDRDCGDPPILAFAITWVLYSALPITSAALLAWRYRIEHPRTTAAIAH
jgi:hypothetical protein